MRNTTLLHNFPRALSSTSMGRVVISVSLIIQRNNPLCPALAIQRSYTKPKEPHPLCITDLLHPYIMLRLTTEKTSYSTWKYSLLCFIIVCFFWMNGENESSRTDYLLYPVHLETVFLSLTNRFLGQSFWTMTSPLTNCVRLIGSLLEAPWATTVWLDLRWFCAGMSLIISSITICLRACLSLFRGYLS